MNVLVTGGGGFLGRAIVDRLLARGDAVRVFARSAYPALEAAGVDVVRGDLSDTAAVRAACDGCSLVFHTAARVALAGRYREFHDTNVLGTQHVIDACRTAGVRRLVFTSSPSVIFDGTDMEGVRESAPYPSHCLASYPQTKAEAERLVRAASDYQLHTVALRPHLIWGPRDSHLVPKLIAAARAGRLRRIGGANKRVDSTYIDNAADAHVLAADRLRDGSLVTGRAYFISNGEPMPLWDLVNAILAAADLPPVTRSIPRPLARLAGAGFELLYGLLPLHGDPPMTRFLADELSTAHWFDITAARRDLGYEPRISIAEGLERLRDWLRTESPLRPRTPDNPRQAVRM